MTTETSSADIDGLLQRIKALQQLLPQATPHCPSSAQEEHLINSHRFQSNEERPCFSGSNLNANNVKEDQRQRSVATMNTAENTSNKCSPGSDCSNIEETLDLLCQATFVRIVVDSLYWDKPPQFICRQFGKNVSPRERGQIILEYQFPAVNGDFQTLRKRVHAAAKTVLPTIINFNHRRVALLKITPALINLWTKSSLWLRILYKGPDKGMIRQIGRCQVSLDQLLRVPFSVETSLPVECTIEHEARGNLRVSIQLGSRLAAFTDRMDELRNTGESHPVHHHHHHHHSNYKYLDPLSLSHKLAEKRQDTVSPVLPAIEKHQTSDNVSCQPRIEVGRRYSTGILMSNSPPRLDLNNSPKGDSAGRSVHMGIQTWNWRSSAVQTDPDETEQKVIEQEQQSENERNINVGRSKLKTSSGTVADRLRKLSCNNIDGPYEVELTIHLAKNLPLVKGPNKEALKPTVYVSYRAEHQLQTSQVVPENTDPVWNWTTRLLVVAKRKNVVLKFWHRCTVRGDRVLGFVSVDLPSARPNKPISGFYDLVDLSQSSTGRVKITMQPIDPESSVNVDQSLLCQSFADLNEQRTNEATDSIGVGCEVDLENKSMNTSFLFPPQQLSPIDAYVEMASRSLLADKLRTNMEELDELIQRLPHNI